RSPAAAVLRHEHRRRGGGRCWTRYQVQLSASVSLSRSRARSTLSPGIVLPTDHRTHRPLLRRTARRRSRCSGSVAVVPVGLGEGELRRALGEERLLTTGDLLLRGGIEPFRRHAVALACIRRPRPRPGPTPVEDLLGSDLTEPGQSDAPLPQLLSGGPRRVRDLVEETELVHLLELHDRGGDEEVSGPRIAEDLGQTTSGAGRVDEAEFGRRDAEDRAGGGDADIAGGGDLRASAHAVAFDGCD